MALEEVRVGYISGAVEGMQIPARGTRFGEQVAQAAHGDYLDMALGKRVFFAATQAGQTTTVGLATTYVGLCVSNPVGNTYNLNILQISCTESVINAAVNVYAYALGFHATTQVVHTAAVTPRSTFFNGVTTPTALADTSATLPTAPFYAGFLATTPTATTNAYGSGDLKGAVVLPPGAFIIIATVAASPASGFWGSIMWEETLA